MTKHTDAVVEGRALLIAKNALANEARRIGPLTVQEMEAVFERLSRTVFAATMIDHLTIEKVAAAIESADVSYSMRLIRLVDGVSTYRLELGDDVEELTDTDDDNAVDLCYARIRQVKQRKQAEAVISVIASTDGASNGRA